MTWKLGQGHSISILTSSFGDILMQIEWLKFTSVKSQMDEWKIFQCFSLKLSMTMENKNVNVNDRFNVWNHRQVPSHVLNKTTLENATTGLNDIPIYGNHTFKNSTSNPKQAENKLNHWPLPDYIVNWQSALVGIYFENRSLYAYFPSAVTALSMAKLATLSGRNETCRRNTDSHPVWLKCHLKTLSQWLHTVTM